MEVLKLVIPFITVVVSALFGFYLTPMVEKRKSNVQTSLLLDNFHEELNDIKEISAEKTEKINKSIEELIRYQAKQIDSCSLNGFSPINHYFLSTTLEQLYSKLSRDQRTAIKALIALINELNSLLPVTLNNPQSVDIHTWNYLVETSANVYFLSQQLYEKKDRFKYEDETNEERTNKALQALRISIDRT